jgi:hypothetical protein
MFEMNVVIEMDVLYSITSNYCSLSSKADHSLASFDSIGKLLLEW